MLRFELHQLDLGDAKVIPLPKLVPGQLGILTSRFHELGFRVRLGRRILASRDGEKVLVDPAGFCLSNAELMDVVAPVIPELLAVPKVQMNSKAVLSEYFTSASSLGKTTVRFNTRLESGARWSQLRGANQSGLTPDEFLVARHVLQGAAGIVRMLTDFPVDGSRKRIIGSRQFYDSPISVSCLANTLRPLGRVGVHNSYLPGNGTFVLTVAPLAPGRDWGSALTELGEWCYLEPVDRERSN